jgi:hypothetical protein
MKQCDEALNDSTLQFLVKAADTLWDAQGGHDLNVSAA